MIEYIGRRLVYMAISFVLLSIAVFVIIRLPPGDYMQTYIQQLEDQGEKIGPAEIADLKRYYGIDVSAPEQYFRWITKFVTGDFGRSFEFREPVRDLLDQMLPFTILISTLTLIITYGVAIPVGIYAATHQYKLSDYVTAFIGFLGLAIPNFMLGLILMYVFLQLFGISVGGLFSREMAGAPWSLAKVWDLIQHLWAPIIIIGTAGTAGLIRVRRGTLLDELGRQYVITARAKGVAEPRLLFKYPVRLAITPVVSTIGWQLPFILSGETIVGIVLSLPTVGPYLFRALMGQDMFMAGSLVMMLGIFTLIGTLISDLLLVIVDPRIRFDRKS